MQKQYFDLAVEKITAIKTDEEDHIREAAKLVAGSLMNRNWVYTFGSGHSQLLAMEVHGRAGGLYPIVHIPDPMNGRAEKVEGFGPILIEGLNFKKGETVFVISNSGRNPEPLEIAIAVKEGGANLIAVTSLAHSKSVTSRHSSGKLLYQLADVVLDTHTPAGDASLAFENSPIRSGALSTVLGAAIMDAVVVEAIEMMLKQGFVPPVLISSNLDGSDEHNQRIMDEYGQSPQPRFI